MCAFGVVNFTLVTVPFFTNYLACAERSVLQIEEEQFFPDRWVLLVHKQRR